MKKCIEQRLDDLEREILILNKNLPLAPDYAHQSLNLLYEPSLATAHASYFDCVDMVDSNIKNRPLISITTPKHTDTESFNFPIDENLHPYPDIIDSWDSNPSDVIDEYGFKMNYEKPPSTAWGVISEFDKMDKDFLEWIKSDEAKKAYEDSKLENDAKFNEWRTLDKC